MKKICCFFIAVLATLTYIQNVKADLKNVCEDAIFTVVSDTEVEITKVHPNGDIKCYITVSSNGIVIEEDYDTITSGATPDNCNEERYTIFRETRNNYSVVKSECVVETERPAYDASTIKCGNVRGIPKGLTSFSRSGVSILKLLVPVILIVLGIIDMLKAASANDDKVMKDATSKFIRRIIAAILVFFVVSFIQFVVRAISNAAQKSNNEGVENDANNIMSCISCFISDEDDCVLDNYLEE